MATKAQRWQAYCDALKNGVATAAEQDKLAEAYAALDPAQWVAMSNADKLTIALREARAIANSRIHGYDDTHTPKVVPDNSIPEV